MFDKSCILIELVMLDDFIKDDHIASSKMKITIICGSFLQYKFDLNNSKVKYSFRHQLLSFGGKYYTIRQIP